MTYGHAGSCAETRLGKVEGKRRVRRLLKSSTRDDGGLDERGSSGGSERKLKGFSQIY